MVRKNSGSLVSPAALNMEALKLYTILKTIPAKYIRIYTEDRGSTFSGVPIQRRKVGAKITPIREISPPQITAVGRAV